MVQGVMGPGDPIWYRYDAAGRDLGSIGLLAKCSGGVSTV